MLSTFLKINLKKMETLTICAYICTSGRTNNMQCYVNDNNF